MTTVHPYAELFPMMSDAELATLADDIKANGQTYPITKDQQGRVVDGRNRLRACQMAGVMPSARVQFFADDAAVLRHVVSSNLHRRHLSESQRAMIAASITNVKHGSNRYADKVDGPIGPSTPLVTNEQAADLLNIGTGSVKRAKRVMRDGIPELQQAVRQGEINVSAADRIAELPEAEQAAAVATRKEGKPKQAQESQSDPEPDPDNDPEARKSRGKGVQLAYEAINCLTRIPKNDALRKRGFQIVTDWIRQNK